MKHTSDANGRRKHGINDDDVAKDQSEDTTILSSICM